MIQTFSYKRWRPTPNIANRTGAAFFTPEFERRIPIRSDDGVFTIGSCFARNVEAFLRGHFNVPSHVRFDDVPEDIRAINDNSIRNRVLWHRYNVFSIRHSIGWSLEPEMYCGFSRLMAVGNDGYLDPYAGCRDILPQADAERMVQWIDGVFKSLRQCRIVIITLGLSEVWEDLETGLVLNCSPLSEMWKAYPGRFRNRLAGILETIEELEKIYRILERHCPRDFNIIVTVSPIPLSATFRDIDIAVANAASKSILRAAAEEWTSRHENVHYFPSYEIILSSEAGATWTEDFRHPTVNSIEHVMKVFLNDFIDRSPV